MNVHFYNTMPYFSFDKIVANHSLYLELMTTLYLSIALLPIDISSTIAESQEVSRSQLGKTKQPPRKTRTRQSKSKSCILYIQVCYNIHIPVQDVHNRQLHEVTHLSTLHLPWRMVLPSNHCHRLHLLLVSCNSIMSCCHCHIGKNTATWFLGNWTKQNTYMTLYSYKKHCFSTYLILYVYNFI